MKYNGFDKYFQNHYVHGVHWNRICWWAKNYRVQYIEDRAGRVYAWLMHSHGKSRRIKGSVADVIEAVQAHYDLQEMEW